MPIALSLVIACYNEEPHLAESVRQIRQTLDACRWDYELIFIDDCSRDRTREIITDLTANRTGCRAVLHAANVGRGGTVTEGLRMARGEVTGFIDIDLEVHCRYIPSMVTAILQDEFDVATGLRVYKVNLTPAGIVRWVLSVGYRRIARVLLGSQFADTETGYKFFRRTRILPVLENCADTHWFWDTEVMLESGRAGLRVTEIPVLFQRKSQKSSSLRIIPDTVAYIKAIGDYRRRVADRERNKRG